VHAPRAQAVPELIASAPRELLEALLATVADAIYLVDPEGRVQFINPAGLTVLGYDHPSELLGRISHPTIHYKRPDGSPFPDEECPMLRPRLTGETVRIDEDWFVRRDGTMVPVAYSSAPLPTPEGRERRRLGRDLHDGAQQRLVHLLMTLSRARGGLAASGSAVAQALDEAVGEARAAIAELRDLVTGIHPAILTNRGLLAAVEALTARAPDPIEIVIPAARWSAEVEAAAYFVIAETLTNVAKHAPGAHATVAVAEVDGRLLVKVPDDGPGGADLDRGSGLRGLGDRVSAAGGELDVNAPPGAGTRVTAVLPLRRT